MKIKLGTNTSIDLDRLIESRLLVQANSGGGKSWAIRRIVEQAFGKKQIIILDPEGEFGNLRSEFDFVYAGKGGEAPVESRSAALLAHRLLELKASTIIDLYELPPQERKHFLKLFCEAMVNAPKDLWHDCIVVIDEAHVFAPEKGESEALGAVIDLASRGRKRGFCAVLATQRPAKLNKDAAAECNNKLIGRASLDIDRKRASEELGFSSKDQVLSLRDLEPGEFYAFGPAISREVIKTTIGDVKVKPPKRGVSKSAIPAPSATVRKILGRLADIPTEVEKEIKTVQTLTVDNTQLKNELSATKRSLQQLQQNPPQAQPPMQIIEKAIKFALEKRRDEDVNWEKRMIAENNRMRKALENVADIIGKILAIDAPTLKERTELNPIQSYMDPVFKKKAAPRLDGKIGMIVGTLPVRDVEKWVGSAGDASEVLTGPEQRILDAIALSESIGIEEPEQTAVAFLAGYTYGGGGFNNPRGALKTKGLVEYRGSRIALTPEGRSMANTPETPLTGQMLRERVMSILPGPEKKLFKALLDAYPEAVSNTNLAISSGYTEGSGGFNNPKGRLRTLGLIDYPSPGFARAKDFLFPM